MWKTQVLVIFWALFNIAQIVDSKDEIKNKVRSHHKVHQEKQRLQKIKERCWPPRCNLICPIQLSPVPNSSLYPPVPESPILLPPDPSFLTDFDPYEFYDTYEGEARSKRRLKSKLTKRQKHVLKQQIRLGNQNGKKAYKFRQFSPSGCYVRCTDYQMPTSNIPVQNGISNGNTIPPVISNPSGPPIISNPSGPPTISNPAGPPTISNPVGPPTISNPAEPPTAPGEQGDEDNDDNDEEDEPYHPGEDQPIEITISPPEKRSHRLKGKFKQEKKSHKH